MVVYKRVQGEPVHYLGEKEFMSLTFRVGPWATVKIPKFWWKRFGNLEPWPEPLVLDLGTGSGVIAISLAYYLPKVHLIATDLSAVACKLLVKMLEAGVLERMSF